MRARTLLGVFLTLLSPVLLADGPAPGYGVSTLPYAPPLFGVSAELSGGDLVVFDGLAVERVSPTGTPVQTYTVLGASVFASFVVLSPDESSAVVGESSIGDLFKVDLVTGAVATLANVPFNYDAVIDSTGTVWVSAFDGGTGGNALLAVDSDTGAVVTRGLFAGFSGPLALESSGDLLVGLADSPNRVVRFTSAQLASATVLDETDGVLATTGWLGLSFMASDPESGELFVVENDFVNFVDPTAILRAGATPASSRLVLEAAAGESFGKLSLRSSTLDPELLREFQPATGGELIVPATDFATLSERRSVRPSRPTCVATGPGTGFGTEGLITFTVTGADPDGLVFLFYGLASEFDPSETAILLDPATPPLFWSLFVPGQGGVPFPLQPDANGEVAFTFYDPGFMGGFVAMQAALSDINLNLVGTAVGTIL